MSETVESPKMYSTGVEYEVLLNSLHQEIAYHVAAARQVGHQTDRGVEHMDMARNLVDIQYSISPFDEQQILMLSTLLQYVRREHQYHFLADTQPDGEPPHDQVLTDLKRIRTELETKRRQPR